MPGVIAIREPHFWAYVEDQVVGTLHVHVAKVLLCSFLCVALQLCVCVACSVSLCVRICLLAPAWSLAAVKHVRALCSVLNLPQDADEQRLLTSISRLFKEPHPGVVSNLCVQLEKDAFLASIVGAGAHAQQAGLGGLGLQLGAPLSAGGSGLSAVLSPTGIGSGGSSSGGGSSGGGSAGSHGHSHGGGSSGHGRSHSHGASSHGHSHGASSHGHSHGPGGSHHGHSHGPGSGGSSGGGASSAFAGTIGQPGVLTIGGDSSRPAFGGGMNGTL